jgi:hypothetical protein
MPSPFFEPHSKCAWWENTKDPFWIMTHYHDISLPAFPRFQKDIKITFPPYHIHKQLTNNLLSTPPINFLISNYTMTIRCTTRSQSPPTMSKPTPCTPKPPSLVNVSHFPTKGWLSDTRPTTCVVPGQIGLTIRYEDYYIHEERVLCTCAFSVAAVMTTVDDGASPTGSTELDDESGHNC